MKRQIRRRRKSGRSLIFFVVLLAFISLTTALGTTSALAKSDKNVSNRKYFTSYRVSKDETLWEIADNYITAEYASKNDYIYEVTTANGLAEAESLRAGEVIILPYYASQPMCE